MSEGTRGRHVTMILPSPHTRPQNSPNALPRWFRLMVRGRFLLAGIYVVALGVLVWAVFFDGRLLDLRAPPTLAIVSTVAAIFFVMQALLLAGAPHFRWPKPRRRRWMGVSLTVGALMAALLTFGFLATLTSLLKRNLEWVKFFDAGFLGFATVIGIPWLFWIFVFAIIWSGEWVDKFHRMYRLLLAGTWLELLVTVPVDVAVRKRTTCYCDEGTFYSLAIGITMAFWTFGPGIVLLFFNIRSRRQRSHGICIKCGYDLRGLLEPRCPECGMPFTPSPETPHPKV